MKIHIGDVELREFGDRLDVGDRDVELTITFDTDDLSGERLIRIESDGVQTELQANLVLISTQAEAGPDGEVRSRAYYHGTIKGDVIRRVTGG